MDAGVFVEIGHLGEKFRFRYGPADVSVLISSVDDFSAVTSKYVLAKILS